MSGKINGRNFYCNPLSIPSIPRGKDEWYPFEPGMFSHENKPESVTGADYRSISDPTVFYWDNKWYLYPSYGMAWVSENFADWEHVRTEPYCPKYSPGIIPWKDGFLMTSWCCPLYYSKSPLGPFELLGDFIKPDGTSYRPCDPCLFADEDGSLYVYFVDDTPFPGKPFCLSICGWEMDRENPRQLIGEKHFIITMDPVNRPWERFGFSGQNTRFGWVEGPHMLKHDGRYYMIYATPNTQYPNYVMAVFYSDESPLTGFTCQKKNPLTVHTNGIVCGAGHGCVEHGPDHTLWAFFTTTAPYTNLYERRIGMARVDVDENGELYCPEGVTDVPMPAPGENSAPFGLLPLNLWCRPQVSSAIPGRDGLYACDGSPLTWWEPESGDAAPTLEADLEADYTASAVRLFWSEKGLDYAAGILPGPFRWLLEGFDGKEWFTLIDCRDNDRDLNVDTRAFPPKVCSRVRLTVTGHPAGIRTGLIDFTVFGTLA